MKQYTAFSGAIAIEISERAKQAGYGHTQAAQLYHYTAQTALNIKHRRDGIVLINKLTDHFLKHKPMKLNEFLSVCEQINPNFTEKDLRKLAGLFKAPKAGKLLVTRNKIKGNAMKYLKDISTVKVNYIPQEEEENLAEAHFSY